MLVPAAIQLRPVPEIPPGGAEQARADAYADASKSQATQRAYKKHVRQFAVYCKERDFAGTDAEHVRAYLAYLADAGKALATIRQALAAIVALYRRVGLPSPAEHCRETVRGIAKRCGRPQKKKSALVDDYLPRVVSATENSLRGLRDRAIVLFGQAGAFRRSDLAALDVEDLDFTYDDRGVVVKIGRSKTDQEARGRELPIPRTNDDLCPVAALQAWLEQAGIETGAVFRTFSPRGELKSNRIDPKDVARTVQRLMGRAQLAGDWGAHSLRAGLITSAAIAGVAEERIQSVSGHQSVPILRGYIRRATLFEDTPLSTIAARRSTLAK